MGVSRGAATVFEVESSQLKTRVSIWCDSLFQSGEFRFELKRSCF